MHDEDRLLEKLCAIETLFEGAVTHGERQLADLAHQRIRTSIVAVRAESIVDWQSSLDPWSPQLFIALARRYGLNPYLERRQRHSTAMLRAPERFLREIFVPKHNQMTETIHAHLASVTNRFVAQTLGGDANDTAMIDGDAPPSVLTAGSGSSESPTPQEIPGRI